MGFCGLGVHLIRPKQDLVHLPQKVSNGLLALGAAKCLMSGTGSAAICDMAHCAAWTAP